MRGKKFICLLLALLLLIAAAGCSSSGTDASEPEAAEQTEQTETETADESAAETETADGGRTEDNAEETPQPTDENFVPYEAPAALYNEYSGDLATADNPIHIDTSHVADGYVAVSAWSETDTAFQVITDNDTYTYYCLAGDGTPSYFPLQSGDVYYTFRALQQYDGDQYAIMDAQEVDVLMNDEFQPWLRPSDYVNYSADDNCVALAAELAATASDAPGVVSAVYDYITANISYDSEKAASSSAGDLTLKNYVPDPDGTLADGTGICIDYAALAAAMLRSQGIPTKMIWGYVAPDSEFHAWNLFYTDETGWVTVEYNVDADSWNRLDLTFSASGKDDSFVEDSSNYTDIYYY